jgi:SAM-dependent methyltransferase
VDEPYYRADLARVHHEGFAHHAPLVAPGILRLLEPVRAAGGLVLEFGAGSGLLTRILLAHGHRVLCTDASPAMLDLARVEAPGAEGYALLRLPDDPVPPADAIVGVGHPISYLPTEPAIHEALVAFAAALRPGGVLAFDVCDVEWGAARIDAPTFARKTGNWAIITDYSIPRPDRFVREMAVFTRNDDGTWRRDDERHDNVLLDTSTLPPLLAEHGVEAEVRQAFGDETLPAGLHVVVGRKAG